MDFTWCPVGWCRNGIAGANFMRVFDKFFWRYLFAVGLVDWFQLLLRLVNCTGLKKKQGDLTQKWHLWLLGEANIRQFFHSFSFFALYYIFPKILTNTVSASFRERWSCLISASRLSTSVFNASYFFCNSACSCAENKIENVHGGVETCAQLCCTANNADVRRLSAVASVITCWPFLQQQL